MMTKLDLLKSVRSARRAHISWVMKADALIHGIPLEEEQVPVNGTECSFGEWFYGEGQSLSALPSYKALEKPHFDLHSTYAKIFSVIYEKSDHSFLSSLFGKAKKVDSRNQELARSLFPELKMHSDTVVKHLEMLEKDIINLPGA